MSSGHTLEVRLSFPQFLHPTLVTQVLGQEVQDDDLEEASLFGMTSYPSYLILGQKQELPLVVMVQLREREQQQVERYK